MVTVAPIPSPVVLLSTFIFTIFTSSCRFRIVFISIGFTACGLETAFDSWIKGRLTFDYTVSSASL